MTDRIVARIATTQPIQVADVRVALTTEALAEAALSLNTQSAARWSLEHDPYTVSTMKTYAARVEHGDEFDSLVIDIVSGRELRIVTNDTETEYTFLRFPEDSMPFVRRKVVDRLSVAVDLANFDSLEDFENFKTVVSADGTPTNMLGRRSAIPDPIIAVSVPAIAGFILFLLLKPIYQGYSKAVSTLTERMILNTAEHFMRLWSDKMNSKMSEVLTKYKNDQSDDARPILIERTFTSNDLNIVLLERVDDNKGIEGVELHQILHVLRDAGQITFTASEITLVRDSAGNWQLWYLHTADGHVIATNCAMKYTADMMAHMVKQREETAESTGDE